MNNILIMKYKLILFGAVFVFGCSTKVSDKILSTLEKCDPSNCIFNMEEVTDFEWDRMYIFGEYSDQEYITRVIGMEWSGSMVSDGNKRFVFIDKDTVVYVEDYSPNQVNIQFRPLDWMGDEIANYNRNEAIFTVVKREVKPNSSSYFYDLYPLEGTLQPDE
ncbi:MAG: hypothetical protein F6K19_37055 [Cyanothece sp. SIO1E1]|nr:hypothetical protein [Cyanothece sp. SIO1E1]